MEPAQGEQQKCFDATQASGSDLEVTRAYKSPAVRGIDTPTNFMAAKTAALGTLRSRQFSASSSRRNMTSPVLDIFDAPARLEDWASRCLRSTYRSATKVSPQDAEMTSLPPPITFDGPSGTHPKRHALMVSPVSSSSVVRLFDGPARPARKSEDDGQSGQCQQFMSS
ncbi:hypothetical protein BDZ89DRAFT_673305 [Hymenopellis radicata]|nr:hypothetical protein BDZ89DRAFT_673305 [Hymenopellis radicata]